MERRGRYPELSVDANGKLKELWLAEATEQAVSRLIIFHATKLGQAPDYITDGQRQELRKRISRTDQELISPHSLSLPSENRLSLLYLDNELPFFGVLEVRDEKNWTLLYPLDISWPERYSV